MKTDVIGYVIGAGCCAVLCVLFICAIREGCTSTAWPRIVEQTERVRGIEQWSEQEQERAMGDDN